MVIGRKSIICSLYNSLLIYYGAVKFHIDNKRYRMALNIRLPPYTAFSLVCKGVTIFSEVRLEKRPGGKGGEEEYLLNGATHDNKIGCNQFLWVGARKYKFLFLLCGAGPLRPYIFSKMPFQYSFLLPW